MLSLIMLILAVALPAGAAAWWIEREARRPKPAYQGSYTAAAFTPLARIIQPPHSSISDRPAQPTTRPNNTANPSINPPDAPPTQSATARPLPPSHNKGPVMTTIDNQTQPVQVQWGDGVERVWRVEVWPRTDIAGGDDPLGRSVLRQAKQLSLAPNLTEAKTARVYLIQASFDQSTVERIAAELLCDPVNQRFRLGATPREESAQTIEVHALPGVMDPVAMSAQDAVAEMLGTTSEPDSQTACEIRTGTRFDFTGASAEEAAAISKRLLANPVVQSVSDTPHWPRKFTEATDYQLNLVHIPIRHLDEAGLQKLSREGHLFLSLEEMTAIRDHFRSLDREPTDVELETLAQTWSEHCVHKTLKATISYTESADPADSPGPTGPIGPTIADWTDRPGHTIQPDGTLVIDNLLKSTIAAATRHLMNDGIDWCVSVFVDNAGIIRFDDETAVTFKVETHNHPSAIEPYGGAATGIGGCIRDTMGTGLCAKPIANTDAFAVADTNLPFDALPKGVLHPRRVLTQIVGGVRDYGNRMGIPTINGCVYFDDRYLGNPLVFAGSVGLIPLDKCFGDAQPGDQILAIGGRTGRDGIHGATFSSAELTDTHADEFAHAVQIGNAITEKKTLDAILTARDHESGCLFTSITDCGAGGFSSAVGEMGEKIGASVELANAPLKYAGLSYSEVWISEAQERMVLAVPQQNIQTITDICEAENVESSILGTFGTENQELVLTYNNTEVGRLSMHFLHEGIPQPTRIASWAGPGTTISGIQSLATTANPEDLTDTLLKLLAHPNIASKHWIIRQYDHEVQGSSVVKPLVGESQDGPSDAAVIRPRLNSHKAIALSNGLATGLADCDPYWMTLAAIDEAVRNAVCTGADPTRIAILDNFCWPSCDKPENLGSLVRAAEACYDGALAYRTPFISGKDSLNNQFTTEDGTLISIPPTLLISAIAIVQDARKAVTMDAKKPGNLLIQIGATTPQLAGSHLQHIGGAPSATDFPRVDLASAPNQLAQTAALITKGLVRSAHDCSEGGTLLAAAEMAMAGRLGLRLDLPGIPRTAELTNLAACFAETPTRILIEVEPANLDAVAKHLRDQNIPFGHIGTFTDSPALQVRGEDENILAETPIDSLLTAWQGTLDW